MKAIVLCLTLAVTAGAQVVVPATPTKFAKKNLGTSISTNGGSSAGIGLSKPDAPTIMRYTTYWSLSEVRQWTSTDGRPLVAKLIAFEDSVVEQIKGQPAPAAPKFEGKPTVVLNGKVRLMANQKPYEVALDKLSEKDRELVEGIRTAVEKAPSK